MIRVTVLAVLFLAACGPKPPAGDPTETSPAVKHAEAIVVVDGALDVFTASVNDECPGLIERHGPPLFEACRTAGEAVAAARDAWRAWARIALLAVEDSETFNLAGAAQALGDVVRFYESARAALEGHVNLPPLPEQAAFLLPGDSDE